MKIFGYITAILFSLLILGGIVRVISIIFLPVRAVDRSIETAQGVIDKTLNAQNAIYNYEWFKQQVEDIKAIQKKVDIAKNSLSDFQASVGPRLRWTFEDRTEESRLRAISQGLQAQEEDMIATYNARAKMVNRNIFQSGLLPNALEFGSKFLK